MNATVGEDHRGPQIPASADGADVGDGRLNALPDSGLWDDVRWLKLIPVCVALAFTASLRAVRREVWSAA
ncbi:hypothetical protein [Nocardia brasiliensis]|uniref:hypothetical protein n=1 Tax=Nocardia brasiliensis TaxID=37326 RepID=UPI002458E26D|nr:hypothetical protein [Nocardia brasiliensis]